MGYDGNLIGELAMRTTVDIDDDVLIVIKEMAQERGVSAGKLVSELARTALTKSEPYDYEDGIPLLPLRPGGEMVTLELVNRLRDEE